MKNSIMYNYNFSNISLLKCKSGYKFKYNNNLYLFQKVMNVDEALEIFELVRDSKIYYSFVFNKDKSIFTYVGSYVFVLLKTNDNKISDINKFILLNDVPIVDSTKFKLNRSNWGVLWENKQDYFEYQMKHLKGKYMLVDRTFDYFTGLCENAISYFNNNILNKANLEKKLFICHDRITTESFFNPLYLVIDYRARDISEYLKFLFFSGKSHDFDVLNFLSNIKFDRDDWILVFCRMLYPSYYFDVYEQVVNGIYKQDELDHIVSLVENYELFLKEIYVYLKNNYDIPSVDWL